MKCSRTFACQCVLTLSFNVTLAGSARSQTQARPPLSKDQIRVVTNEVISPVTVTDTSGEFVLDLAQKDFHVFDDGVEQTIEQWDLGGDPLAVALLIDTSTRLHAMEPTIHRMGSIFTETVMALDGQAAVITYDSTVDVRQPFTQDHDAVQKAIAETKFEVPEMKSYDAMATAVELLKAQPTTRRRIMLIVGESQDSGSKANLGQIVRDAEHANIAIYAVGPSSIAADLRGSNKGVAPLKLPATPRIETVPPVDTDPLGRPIPVYDWMTPAMWLLQRGTNEVKNHAARGRRRSDRRNSLSCFSRFHHPGRTRQDRRRTPRAVHHRLLAERRACARIPRDHGDGFPTQGFHSDAAGLLPRANSKLSENRKSSLAKARNRRRSSGRN